jgi:hypothetical protein
MAGHAFFMTYCAFFIDIGNRVTGGGKTSINCRFENPIEKRCMTAPGIKGPDEVKDDICRSVPSCDSSLSVTLSA